MRGVQLMSAVAAGSLVTAAFSAVGGVAGAAAAPARVAESTAASATTPGGGSLQSLSPARLLDTRIGTGAAQAAIGAHRTLKLRVTGRGGVPTTGVSAVVLTVTATRGTAAGDVRVYADAAARPVSSNLNYGPGRTVANLVLARVGADGDVDLYNDSTGSVQLVADVSGYYRSGSTIAGGYVPVGPVRDLDTRTGSGPTALSTVQITGSHGFPASGVSAVAVNLTAVAPAENGYATAYPAGQTAGATSALNFVAGQTTANLAIVALGTGGRISIALVGSPPPALLVDVYGYFTSGTPAAGGLTTVPAFRTLDTRVGNGAPAAALGAHQSLTVTVAQPGSAPAAAVIHVTATQPTANGYLTVYPTGTNRPTASNISFAAGRTVSDLALTRLGGNGTASTVTIYNGSAGSVQVVADTGGFYLASGARLWDESPAPRPATVPTYYTSLDVVSCPTAGACVAAGEYNGSGLLEVQSGSTWTDTIAPLPAGAQSNAVSFTSISCPAAGTCFAAGYYTPDDGKSEPVIEKLAGGTWTATEPPLPSNQDGDFAFPLLNLSCASTTSCVGAGSYSTTGDENQPIIETLAGGGWTYTAPTPPAGSLSGELAGVSCPSSGHCVAVGRWDAGHGNTGRSTPVVLTQDGTTWTPANPGQPAGDDPDIGATIEGVACPTVGWCVATGTNGSQTFFDRLTGGTWTTTVTPAPAGATHRANFLDDIACPSVGHCTAIGNAVTGEDAVLDGQLDTLDGTTWTAVAAPRPSSVTESSDSRSGLSGLSCATATSCAAVGSYAGYPVVDVLTGGSWRAAVTQLWTGTNPGLGNETKLNDVSCATATSCVAAGSFFSASSRLGYQLPMLDTTVG